MAGGGCCLIGFEQVAAKTHGEKDPVCLSLKVGSSWVDLAFTLWMPHAWMEVAIRPSAFQCPVPTVHTGALKAISVVGEENCSRHTLPVCHVLSTITQL